MRESEINHENAYAKWAEMTREKLEHVFTGNC